MIQWMEEILHQLVDGKHAIVIPYHLQCFIVSNSYPAWCRISSIHSNIVISVWFGILQRLSVIVKSRFGAWVCLKKN